MNQHLPIINRHQTVNIPSLLLQHISPQNTAAKVQTLQNILQRQVQTPRNTVFAPTRLQERSRFSQLLKIAKKTKQSASKKKTVINRATVVARLTAHFLTLILMNLSSTFWFPPNTTPRIFVPSLHSYKNTEHQISPPHPVASQLVLK